MVAKATQPDFTCTVLYIVLLQHKKIIVFIASAIYDCELPMATLNVRMVLGISTLIDECAN